MKQPQFNPNGQGQIKIFSPEELEKMVSPINEPKIEGNTGELKKDDKFGLTEEDIERVHRNDEDTPWYHR